MFEKGKEKSKGKKRMKGEGRKRHSKLGPQSQAPSHSNIAQFLGSKQDVFEPRITNCVRSSQYCTILAHGSLCYIQPSLIPRPHLARVSLAV